jgi:nitrogen fixation protein NifU and related proteins
MSDLRDLYQEVILDHGKRPRNFRRPAAANRHSDGHNPLCGDRLRVWLEVEGDTVLDVAFQGSGCAISTASASMMTEAIKGRTVTEARALFERFHDMLTLSTDGPSPEGLGKLAVFAGVKDFPVRVKCATLPWHTMKAALETPEGATVSTE